MTATTRGRPTKILVAVALVLQATLALLAGAAHAGARDSDGDRMPNRWERNHGLNPYKANARGDADSDRLRNIAEYRKATDPKDEDSDDDGSDDGDEVKDFDTDPDESDSDEDGVLDGDEDFDRDGISDEDEDDGEELCRADDDDADDDGVDDEDENELGIDEEDADSDDDGVLDGNEDIDKDGVDEEDEDDAAVDVCKAEETFEDDDDVFANVVSFDEASGQLTVRSVAGKVIVGTVTAETELEWEDEACSPTGEDEATTADLLPETPISDLEFSDDTGALEEVELYCGDSGDEEDDA